MKTAEQWVDQYMGEMDEDLVREIQADAIEAAAQVCERTKTEAESPGRGGLLAGKVCADAVRLLKETP